MKTVEIEKGPHLLFVGQNGSRTHGVTLRSLRPREQVEDRGRRRTWSVNINTVRHAQFAKMTGLSETEHHALVFEIERLDCGVQATDRWCSDCEAYVGPEHKIAPLADVGPEINSPSRIVHDDV